MDAWPITTRPGIRWFALMFLFVTRLAAADPASDAAARERADTARVAAAAEAMATGGAVAMEAHIAGLHDVLSHIPKHYRRIEAVGGEIQYRAVDGADLAAFTAWTAERAKAKGTTPRAVVRLPDTYPTASFMLAWYYNERKQPDQAMAAADIGLAARPIEARLVAEKGQGLLGLQRYEMALALYDETLSSTDFMPPLGAALILRAKGFSLIELRRYVEAEKAYHDSLVLEPDHQLARNELAYIARIRSGGATAPTITIPYEKAKKGQY